MFEENYSYSMIAKELSHNKGWVSKWTRHCEMNPAESFQSRSWRWLTNKTALNLPAQRIIHNSKHQTLHSTASALSSKAGSPECSEQGWGFAEGPAIRAWGTMYAPTVGSPSRQWFWCFLCSQMTSPAIENPACTVQVWPHLGLPGALWPRFIEPREPPLSMPMDIWLQLFMPAQSRRHWRHSNVVSRNLGDQFLWPLCKSHRFDSWETEGSHEKQRRHCSTNKNYRAYTLAWSNAVVTLLCNFWVLQH